MTQNGRLKGQNTKCAVPTLFLYPCGGDVLIVESNYDITNIHEGIFEKLLASEVIEVFLVKAHHQNTNIRRTEVNFNNTFSENLIHNMRLSLIPLRRLRMNGNNVGIWVEVSSLA